MWNAGLLEVWNHTRTPPLRTTAGPGQWSVSGQWVDRVGDRVDFTRDRWRPSKLVGHVAITTDRPVSGPPLSPPRRGPSLRSVGGSLVGRGRSWSTPSLPQDDRGSDGPTAPRPRWWRYFRRSAGGRAPGTAETSYVSILGAVESQRRRASNWHSRPRGHDHGRQLSQICKAKWLRGPATATTTQTNVGQTDDAD